MIVNSFHSIYVIYYSICMLSRYLEIKRIKFTGIRRDFWNFDLCKDWPLPSSSFRNIQVSFFQWQNFEKFLGTSFEHFTVIFTFCTQQEKTFIWKNLVIFAWLKSWHSDASIFPCLLLLINTILGDIYKTSKKLHVQKF